MDFRTYLCESLNTEVSDIEILEDEKEIFRVRFKIGAESPYLVVFIFENGMFFSSFTVIFLFAPSGLS